MFCDWGVKSVGVVPPLYLKFPSFPPTPSQYYMYPTFPIRSISIIHPATFFIQNLLPKQKVKIFNTTWSDRQVTSPCNCHLQFSSDNALALAFFKMKKMFQLAAVEQIASEEQSVQQRRDAKPTVSDSHSPPFHPSQITNGTRDALLSLQASRAFKR